MILTTALLCLSICLFCVSLFLVVLLRRRGHQLTDCRAALRGYARPQAWTWDANRKAWYLGDSRFWLARASAPWAPAAEALGHAHTDEADQRALPWRRWQGRGE